MADVYIDIGAQLDSASLEQVKSQITGIAGQVKINLGSNNLSLDRGSAQKFVNDLGALIRSTDPGKLRNDMQSVLQQAIQGLRTAEIVQPTNASQQMSNIAMNALFGGNASPEAIARAVNQRITDASKLINQEAIAGAAAFRAAPLAERQAALAGKSPAQIQQYIQGLGREQLAEPLSVGAQAVNSVVQRTQAQLAKNAAEQIRIGTEFYGKLAPEQQKQLVALANGDPVKFAQTMGQIGGGFVGNQEGTQNQRAQLLFLQEQRRAAEQAVQDEARRRVIGRGLVGQMTPADQAKYKTDADIAALGSKYLTDPVGRQTAIDNLALDKQRMAREAAAVREQQKLNQERAQAINIGRRQYEQMSPEGRESFRAVLPPGYQPEDVFASMGSDLVKDPARSAEITAGLKMEAMRSREQANALKEVGANRSRGLQIFNQMTAEGKAAFRGKLSPEEFITQTEYLGMLTANPAERAKITNQLALQKYDNSVSKQKPVNTSENILKTYQKAAAFYQAGNIASALGLPGGQQLGLMGSTMQALAPTSLAGAAPAIGLGLVGVQMGKQAIEDTLKAYMPVEQQFMRVQTLTQTSKAQIKDLEQQVRGLSVETGLTQEDLTKSLYYISSSGFRGNDAFTILNATVKASAAGLGDVAGVADIVTSMMNAYGIKASGAFSVTDKLITAIREGKAEPEQFARSLGQVLPIAREAGIGLDEVLSSVSAITLQGFSAPQAITSIRQAISNLISPSKEAAKELDLFYGEGKGVITVQAKLQTEGFQATLQDLYQKTGGNLQSLDAIFGNIRGLSGVLALANGEFAKMDDITKQIANSSGVTKGAFEDATKTTQSEIKKMEAAWEDLKIELGERISPLIIPIITRVTTELSLGGRSAMGESGFKNATDLVKVLEDQVNAPTNFSLGGEFIRTLARIRLDGNENPLIQFLEGGGFGRSDEGQYSNRDLAQKILQSRKSGFADNSWYMRLSNSGLLPNAIPTAADLTGGAYEDYTAGISGGGGTTDVTRTSDVFITGEKVKFNKAVAEWGAERAKAIGMIEKLNEQLANAIFSGLDQMQGRAEGYDDFFGKLSEVDKKLSASPDFVQVYKENGKTTTLSAQQKEDEKIRTLKNQISIEEQKNLIREARKPSKDGNQNVLRGLQDKLYDDQLNAKKNQLADLEKGQAGRSVITVKNEQDKKALEERRILLEQYDKQTYDIVKTQFQAGLVGSADDPEGFNFLLKNGGDLLSRFANNAGLFKTSGFAAAIAEAALQMKYLRGPDGQYLKGEDFAVGFGEYSSALEQFRGKLKDMAPYLSGDQKMTIPIAVDMKLVPVGTTDLTNVGEVRRKITGGGERDEAGKRIKTDVSTLVKEGIDVTTPQGQVQQLMKNMGFDVESGLQASFKINMELASPGLAGDVELIKAKLQGLDELKNGIIIPVGIELSKTGLNPENLVDKDNKAILQEMFNNLLPKEGEMGNNNIVWSVPISMVVPAASGVNTSPVEDAIKKARQDVYERWKDQQLEAATNITTTVDVATVNIQNSEVMRVNYIKAIEAALGGYKFVPPDNTDDGSNHAIGGWEMHGGMAKVGELGPEYLYLPRGTGVIPANIVNAISGVMPKANRDNYMPDTRQSSVTYFAPQNKTYMNYSIDARGAQEPKRTRDAVVRALTARDIEKISKKRARETGGRTF